jgi:cell division protein FtsB
MAEPGRDQLALVRSLREQNRDLAQENAALKDGGGSGTSGGMSDDWKTSVETRLTDLHNDVRNMLYGLIAGFILLGTGGWVVYDKLSDASANGRVEQAKAMGDLQTRNAEMTGKIELLLERTAKK